MNSVLQRIHETGGSTRLLVFLVAFFVLLAFVTGHIASNDFSTVYLGFVALFVFTKQRKLNVNPSWFIYPALLAAVAIAAASLARIPEISFAKLYVYRDLFLLGFTLHLLLQNQLAKVADSLFLACICVFLVVTPTTLSEYFAFSTQTKVQGARYISPELSYFSHIRHYSYLAFIASCLSLILYLRANRFEFLMLCLLVLCFLSLILSTGRAAILSFLFFMLLIFAKRLPFKKLIGAGVLSSLGLLLIFGLVAVSPYSALTDSLILRSQHMTDINQLLSGRIDFWVNIIKSVADTPLLGLGPNSYQWSLAPVPGAVQPHSALFQLILEYGYFGGGVILIVTGTFVVRCAKASPNNHKDRELHSMLSAFVFSYLLYSLVDGLFYHTVPMLFFTLILTVWYSLTKKSGSDPDD